MRWRLLRTPPRAGAVNMALDEALMERARRTGEVVLRIYEWEPAALSFGRNQPARGLYDVAKARAAGVDFVRRPTGGRAVLHAREVTYSVTAPDGALGSPRESYRTINRLLVDGLWRLGVRASMVDGRGGAPRPSVAPCFEEPVAGEIVAEARKLVGSAQYRERGALLQHGSILVDDDQTLATALVLDADAVPSPPATLRQLLGHAPSADEVGSALTDAVRERSDTEPDPLPMDDWLESAAEACRSRYDSADWTWRR